MLLCVHNICMSAEGYLRRNDDGMLQAENVVLTGSYAQLHAGLLGVAEHG